MRSAPEPSMQARRQVPVVDSMPSPVNASVLSSVPRNEPDRFGAPMLAGTVPKARKLVNWRISRNPAQEMKGAPTIAGRPGLSELFGYSVLSIVISEEN